MAAPLAARGSTAASIQSQETTARHRATRKATPSCEWGFAWPANRRILYNRASADPQGRPWSERKKYVWWDEEQKKWTGYDIPDFPVNKAPDLHTCTGRNWYGCHSGSDPFIMKPDGKGWLFVPKGLKDGPLPDALRGGRVACP